MGYFRDIEEQKFISCIRENYDFLVDEYDFQYSSDDSREHYYKTDSCEISILYYRYELDVYITPLCNGLVQFETGNRFPGKDVGLVAFQFGADGPTRLSHAHAETNIVAELELRAQQLREYCEPFLLSDFSTWPRYFKMWTVDPKDVQKLFEGLSFDKQYDLYWKTNPDVRKHLDQALQNRFLKEHLRRRKKNQ